MKREQITSISGTSIYTDYGRRVAIGNADHKVGDWVWVDGNYVFGHKVDVQNVPYIPQVASGVLLYIRIPKQDMLVIINPKTKNVTYRKVKNRIG